MATSKQPTRKSSGITTRDSPTNISSDSLNLESTACLWLDQNVDLTEDNRETYQQLRQVINHLRTFTSSDLCEQYIRKITHEKVVLIVSGSLGRQVVPRLHSLPQFGACYVFCQDKAGNEEWANNYPKVKGVFVKRSEIVTTIAQDQAARSKVEDGASISVIKHGSKSLQAHNAIFMWFQLFIEVLLRMHHKSADRQELIDICKKNYMGNEKEMAIIDEFENNYKSDDAIWWYTREACFYRLMNKALRVQDYDILLPLRFFITDIAKQLRSEHEKFIRTNDTRNVIRVYRGQMIGIDELELMKNSIGEFLTMNSFLSTSRNRETAVRFVRSVSISDGNQRILFEIEIDPRLKTKAFADIIKMSYYQHEDEILIMLGALFRIQNIVEDQKNGIWIAHVSLASEDDYQLKETFVYMKKEIGDDTNLDSLGKILLQMGEYRQAEKCYERMLTEAQIAIGDARFGIGLSQDRCEEYDKSLEHLTAALTIRMQVLGENHTKVGDSYRRIGAVHWAQGNYKKALTNMKKALEIHEKTTTTDSVTLARTYNTMAILYHDMKKPDMALQFYKKTLKVQLANLPLEHPDIATTYNNLGWYYDVNKNFEKALDYYEKSLQISQKILPPSHTDIVRTENNITIIKEKMKK